MRLTRHILLASLVVGCVSSLTIIAQEKKPTPSPAPTATPLDNKTSPPAPTEPPLDRKQQNQLILKTLRDVINQGADLYNGGDFNGCYRLYEGTLLAMLPMVDHRPNWQKAITDGIATAKRNTETENRAFDLRKVIDRIYLDIKAEKPDEKPTVDEKKPEPTTPTVDVKKPEPTTPPVTKPTPPVDVKKPEPTTPPVDVKKPEPTTPPVTKPTPPVDVKKPEPTTPPVDVKKPEPTTPPVTKPTPPVDVKKPEPTTLPITKPTPPVPQTLWDKLGGEKVIVQVIDDFVATASKDPKVNITRDGKIKDIDVAKLKLSVRDFVSAASGGPHKYTGKNMKEAHAGMAITREEFDAHNLHFQLALEKNGIKKEDASVLLKALADTGKDIVEPKTPAPVTPPTPPAKPEDTSKVKAIWETLGGEVVVKKIVDDFVTLAAEDPKVNFFREGKLKDKVDMAKLSKHLVDFVSNASGGPQKYNGKAMKEAHKDMKITDAEFDALVSLFELTLTKHKVDAAQIKTLLKAVNDTKADIVGQ